MHKSSASNAQSNLETALCLARQRSRYLARGGDHAVVTLVAIGIAYAFQLPDQ